MDIRVLETISELKLICNTNKEGVITKGYTSDLLSDVLANCDEDSVFMTIQAHKNTVAVASIVGVEAIILCNDRPIPPEMISAAEEAEIALFVTEMTQYEASLFVGALMEKHA